MTNANVVVDDELVIKLILDFFNTRKLHKCLRILEKETGVVNCDYSDDVLFLRQLILDGEWESVLIFGQHLETLNGFDLKTFRYLVLKQKFMEVLFFKSGIGSGATSYSIEDLLKCLNQLEKDIPSKEEYDKLCWLLTVPNLSDQPEYRNWNPETARIKCFEQVLKVIPLEKRGLHGKNCKVSQNSSRDRLVNLLVKGICLESCIEYCQQRAIIGDELAGPGISINSGLLSGMPQETTGNFLSWLKSLTQDAFTTPFEPVAMEVEFRRFKNVRGAKEEQSTLISDNEILSRSLSLSGRPATADVTSQLSKSETSSKISQKRSVRAKTFSNSYSDFHFHSNSGKQPQQSLNTREHIVGQSHSDRKESQTAVDLPKEHGGQDKETNDGQISSSLPKKKQEVRNSILSLKQEQQESVLSQLEEHKKQQKELQRQLIEFSNKLNSDVQQLEEVASTNSEKVELTEFEKSQNVLNVHCNNDVELEKSSVGQKTYVINNIKDKPPSQQLNAFKSSGNDQLHSHLSVGNELEENQKSSTFTQVLTSTPAANEKVKIKPLKLEESNVDALPNNSGAVTASAENFPLLTPKENRSFGPGHWITLADGSGVLNTSTPKSCRQKMSETPAPLASPVLSVGGQTPITGSYTPRQNTPLSQAISKEDLNLEGIVQNGEVPAEEKEKENPAVVPQQLPVRKGPKINGVRRSLLPHGQSVDKPPPSEEKKNTQTVESDKVRHTETLSQLNVQSKSDSPVIKNSKPAVCETPKTRSGPVAKSKLAQGKQSQANCKPEIKQSSGFNVTYHKHATAPPSNTTVVIGNSNKLLERQQEMLRSSSHPRFSTVATLEDVQAIRAVAFHPLGEMFAVGSNSKTLRICSTSGLNLSGCKKNPQSQENLQVPQPTVLYVRNKHHRGSIYCVAWNNQGDLVATGSNDKSIKMIHFDAENCTQIGNEFEMNIHAGTVRDLSFVSRPAGLPVLVSGGAADGNILISDCSTGQTVGTLKGHAGAIMTVYAAGDDIIASGSADHTVRLWDLRSQRCIDVIAPGDSGVASVCVNHLGSLLASGHEDGSCMIYDITAGRSLQLFKPHTMDCRTVRFSPGSHFLLSGSYDTSILLMDVKQNLESNKPPYYVVAEHKDKVIQCRWHPNQLAFLSSSADRKASLWTLDC